MYLQRVTHEPAHALWPAASDQWLQQSPLSLLPLALSRTEQLSPHSPNQLCSHLPPAAISTDTASEPRPQLQSLLFPCLNLF